VEYKAEENIRLLY